VASRGETERASGELVSGNYFEVLGVPPALGPRARPADDVSPGGHPLAVLSHGYWTSALRRGPLRPELGHRRQRDDADDRRRLAKAGFAGVQPGRNADVFIPISMKAAMTPFWDGMDDPKDYWVQLIGRLKPGLSRGGGARRGLAATYRPILQSDPARASRTGTTRRRAEFLNGKIRPRARAVSAARTLRSGAGPSRCSP
jgi:hypothetical protein